MFHQRKWPFRRHQSPLCSFLCDDTVSRSELNIYFARGVNYVDLKEVAELAANPIIPLLRKRLKYSASRRLIGSEIFTSLLEIFAVWENARHLVHPSEMAAEFGSFYCGGGLRVAAVAAATNGSNMRKQYLL